MTPISTFISTARLALHLLEEKDASALLDAAHETQLALHDWYGGTLSKADLNLEEVKSYIQDCSKEFSDKTFILYGAFEKKTGRLIGIGCLHHLDWSVPKGRIGYWVRSSEHGKGYATEIANVLTRLSLEKIGLERIEIRAETRNPASGTVARKLGYQFLTVFEKNKRGPSGDLWNLEIYARLDCSNLPELEILYE